MRLIRILIASAIVLCVPVLTASAANASLAGDCTASGTIGTKGYNPKVQDKAVIPRKGDVHWQGAVGDGTGSGKRDIEGKVYIKLPPPIGSIEVGGSWNGPSDTYKNNGTYHYDLPSVLVGPKITVFGHHSEPGTFCTGQIEVQIKGSKLSNPILLASLAFTVAALVNIALVVRVKGAGS